MKRNRKRWILVLLAALIISVGVVIADTATKTQNVNLRVHIQVCRATDQGGWQVIDEVGPITQQFQASLRQLASGWNVSSAFVLNARSKKGTAYGCRLLKPADISFNPATGQVTGNPSFDITWGNKKATVPASITTESLSTPIGTLSGKRATGILGKGPTKFKLVSANDLLLPGEAPLKLVCNEDYTFTPQ